MQVTLKGIICILVYSVLSIITLVIIIRGPLKDLFGKVGTTFVDFYENIADLEYIEWPEMDICVNPNVKNKEKFYDFQTKGFSKSFSNESEYQTFLEEIYYTKTDDIVFAIGVGKSYIDALNSTDNVLIKPPIVSQVKRDFTYFGYCATICFEELRKIMISRGEINPKAKDSSFFTLIWLKVILQNFTNTFCV